MNIPRQGMGTADYRCATDEFQFLGREVEDWTGCQSGEIWNEKRGGSSGPVRNSPVFHLPGMGDAAYDTLFAAFKANSVPEAAFEENFPNAQYPNPEACLKIQCGAMSQAEAGPALLFACSNAGFRGVKTCAHPLCAPYCGNTAASVARASQPLPVAPRVSQMMAAGPARGCSPVYWGPKFGGPYTEGPICPGSCSGDFINEHPLLSVALLAAASYGIYRWRGGR